MNTANWIPDLFMKRVMEGGDWTLFSPSDVPDLHDKFGTAFEEAYVAYEDKAARGEIKLFKKIPAARPVAQDAVDAVRDRASLDHVQGRLQRALAAAARRRGAQLATCAPRSRSTPATTEIAVCNLGSVNLAAAHRRDGELDHDKLKKTIAHRDAHARQRDRHQLLRGQEGAQLQPAPPPGRPRASWASRTALHELRVPYASQEAVEFADRSMEAVCYHAYWASTELAAGARPLLELSRARCGTAASCRWTRSTCWPRQRGGYVEVDRSSTLDWDALRERIKQHGMRNSNCVAIAPTATISNIIGVDASIEPTLQQPVRSSRTCRASSPSSTSTWCAT